MAEIADTDLVMVTTARLAELEATAAKVAELEATAARVPELEAAAAKVPELEATAAKVPKLEADCTRLFERVQSVAFRRDEALTNQRRAEREHTSMLDRYRNCVAQLHHSKACTCAGEVGMSNMSIQAWLNAQQTAMQGMVQGMQAAQDTQQTAVLGTVQDMQTAIQGVVTTVQGMQAAQNTQQTAVLSTVQDMQTAIQGVVSTVQDMQTAMQLMIKHLRPE